jgi:hypothetical protein
VCTLYHVVVSLVQSVAVPSVFLGKTNEENGKIQKLINEQGRIRASIWGQNVEN